MNAVTVPRAALLAKCVAFLHDEASRSAVAEAAASLGWSEPLTRDGGVGEAIEALGELPGRDWLVVDVSQSADPLADLDRLAEVCEPGARVLVVGAANDVGLYRALLRLGVCDYLVKPLSPATVAEALRHGARETMEPARIAEPATARTVAVMGVRGGAGATSLAVSLAAYLAETRQQRAVLLDLDLTYGSAALSFDLEPGRGLRELLQHPERVDHLLVASAAVRHGDRLRVLAAEEPLHERPAPARGALNVLVTALAPSADAIVVDAPRGVDGLSAEAVERADTVVLVADLTLAAARDARRLLAWMNARRGDREVLVVANRVGTPGELPVGEFERALGGQIALRFARDDKAAATAAEAAAPLFGRGAGEVELKALADRLFGATAERAPVEARSWLQRVLRR